MYTRAPASSNPRAIMSPIPRLPPVTTAVFPDRSNKSMISPIQNPGRSQRQAGSVCHHTQRAAARRGFLPGQQGQGLGQEILTEAERLAREEWGAVPMIMTVLVQRLDLIAWYLGSTGS